MLIYRRQPGQSLRIGRDITVRVTSMRSGTAYLGVSAPRGTVVHRGETEPGEPHRSPVRSPVSSPDGWIQTRSGKRFDLSNPDPVAINPADLAVSLSRLCRYAGHCIDFYSVAQHSVLVCDLIEDPDLKLPALLHDAHEAYWGFCDPQRPVKALMPPSVVEFVEAHRRRIDAAIAERFRFRPMRLHDPRIKLADRVACATEFRDVMGPAPAPWHDMPLPSREHIIEPLPPDEAAALFLERLAECLEAVAYC